MSVNLYAAQAVPGEAAGGRRLSAHLDWPLLLSAAALVALGLVMVASASISTAARQYGDPLAVFYRQGVFALVSIAAGFVVLHVPMAVWRRINPALLLGGIVLLALVLIPGIGREVNGSTRWIRFGSVNLQPSEPVKLLVILFVAGYLVRRADEVRHSLTGFVKPVAVLMAISALLLLEPDYGATVVLFTTALGMLFLGGVPFWTFAGWAALICTFLGLIVLAAPYRVERLLSFVNPWADPFGSGFQLTQALIAIGRGEWLGVGLGAGVQKLFYLPEAHTDFLFAILAEELGIVGVVSVIALFTFIGLRAMRIGRGAETRGRRFEAHVAYGLGLLLSIQAFVNIGVNLGILPTKGLTLPLMSYGGSSLLANCAGIALLLRIDAEARGLK